MLTLAERVAKIQRAHGFPVWKPLERGPYPTFTDPPMSMGIVTLADLVCAQHLMSKGLYRLARCHVWDAIMAAYRAEADHPEEADDWLYDTLRRLRPMMDLPVPSGGNAQDRRRSIRSARWIWGGGRAATSADSSSTSPRCL